MSKLIFVLILFSLSFGTQTVRDSLLVTKSMQVDSAFYVGKKPLATNPKYAATFDSAGNLMKIWPIASIQKDSVTHAVYSDTADTALNTPDSVRAAHKAYVLKHNVTVDQIPYANTDTTFVGSGITINNAAKILTSPYRVFKIENGIADSASGISDVAIANRRRATGTSGEINFYNSIEATDVYHSPLRLSWKKVSTDGHANRFIIEKNFTENKRIISIFDSLYSSTDSSKNQIILNDTTGSIYTNWQPVWVRNYRPSDSLAIDNNGSYKQGVIKSISSTDSLAAWKNNELVSITGSTMRTLIGAATPQQISDSLDIIRDTLAKHADTLEKYKDHANLNNLNSSNYTHLTSTNHTDLTDAGASTLHYHASDRDRANHTGTQAQSTIIGLADTLANRLPLHGKADSAVISDSTKKNGVHGVTQYRLPYSNATNAWGTTTLRYSPSYTNFGIGTDPTSNSNLYMYYTPTNVQGICGNFHYEPTVSTTASYGGYALIADTYTHLTSGANDNGNYIGFYGRALHLTAGTIQDICGAKILFGTYGNENASNISRDCYGLYLEPERGGTGTINRSCDIYISGPIGTGATVTNDWAILSYHNAPSQIEGHLYIDNDASKIIFGEGQDASIYYDGTNMIFDSRVAGTGNYHLKNGKVKLWNLNIGRITKIDSDSTLANSGIIDSGKVLSTYDTTIIRPRNWDDIAYPNNYFQIGSQVDDSSSFFKMYSRGSTGWIKLQGRGGIYLSTPGSFTNIDSVAIESCEEGAAYINSAKRITSLASVNSTELEVLDGAGDTFTVVDSLFDGGTFRTASTAAVYKIGRMVTVSFCNLTGTVTADTNTYIKFGGNLPASTDANSVQPHIITNNGGQVKMGWLYNAGVRKYQVCNYDNSKLSAGTSGIKSATYTYIAN